MWHQLLATFERYLSTLVDSIPTAIVVIRPDGAINLMNTEAEKLFGHSRAELIGQPIEMLVPERFRARHPVLRNAYISKPEARPMGLGRDLFGLRKDGTEFPVEIGLNPMPTDEGMFVLAAIIDRKRHEEELRHANEQLMRSNIELQQFAYIASHDLQTPLRGITGFIQALKLNYSDRLDDRANDWIDRSIQSAERLHLLIRDLLSYSRIDSQASPFAPVSLEEIVAEARGLLQVSIDESKANISISDLPIVQGDRTQLAQLFQNLIGNALKYRGVCPPELHISCSPTAEEWVICVADNGLGIEPQYQDQISEIFKHLHTQQEYPGTGIGLAVCRRVVHRHGGKIWVESLPGQGSQFYFTLPKL